MLKYNSFVYTSASYYLQQITFLTKNKTMTTDQVKELKARVEALRRYL